MATNARLMFGGTMFTDAWFKGRNPYPQHGRGPTDYDWEQRKRSLEQLYLAENSTLTEVMAAMERKHGFTASRKMYKTRFIKWGWHKYQSKSRQIAEQAGVPILTTPEERSCHRQRGGLTHTSGSRSRLSRFISGSDGAAAADDDAPTPTWSHLLSEFATSNTHPAPTPGWRVCRTRKRAKRRWKTRYPPRRCWDGVDTTGGARARRAYDLCRRGCRCGGGNGLVRAHAAAKAALCAAGVSEVHR